VILLAMLISTSDLESYMYFCILIVFSVAVLEPAGRVRACLCSRKHAAKVAARHAVRESTANFTRSRNLLEAVSRELLLKKCVAFSRLCTRARACLTPRTYTFRFFCFIISCLLLILVKYTVAMLLAWLCLPTLRIFCRILLQFFRVF